MASRFSKQIKGAVGALGVASMMAFASPSLAQEPFLGEIKFFGGNFAPRGWSLCDGQLVSINSNQALFSILGTMYGGDGRTTFGLPDMRGRSPLHPGNGPGLPTIQREGEMGGAVSFNLSVNQMPSHSHPATTTTTSTLRAFSGAGNINSPGGNVLSNDGSDRIYSASAPDVDMHADAIVSTSDTTTANQGGSQAVSHRSPFIAVNCIIAVQGLFPSRN